MINPNLESKSAVFKAKAAKTELFSLFNGEKLEILMVVVYSTAIALLSLLVPIGVQVVVNIVAFGLLLNPVMLISLLVFFALVISGVLSLTRYWLVEIIQRRIFVRVSISLAYRLSRMCQSVFKEEFSPELVNRFFEVALVQKSLSKLVLDGIAVAIQAIVGMVLLSFYHPLLLVYSIVIFAAFFITLWYPYKSGIYTSTKESSAKHSVLIWLENIAASPLLFKNIQGRAFGSQIADELTLDYVKKRQSHFKILFTQNVGFMLIQSLGSALMLGLSGYLVINEELSIGQLVAAELIVMAVLASLSKTGSLIESFYDLVASLAKLDSLAQLPLENYAGDTLDKTQSKTPMQVKIEKMSLSFGNGYNALENISLDIAAGERIAIFGGNGSGKSVLADLLIKFEEPSSGSILLDKYSTKDLNPESIRQQVVLIRNLEIFRGTISDNLRIGNEQLSNKSLREVLEKVGLLSTIEQLPEGLNTILGENGRPLSSGQAMRLMFARSILLEPRLFIIDESLDSLDKEVTCDVIMPLICDPKAPWTLIVMTHDQELAGLFPRSYELSNACLTKL